MDEIELRLGAFATAFGLLEIIFLIFLVIIVSETVWDFVSGARKRYGETLANFAIAGTGVLLERIVYGIVFVGGLLVTEAFAPLSLPLTWWTWVAAVLLADFTYYWMHRLEHEIRILWAHHSVHHSSPEFNMTTALRLSWVEGLVEWIFLIPMVLIGFDVFQVVVAISIVATYQTWIHTTKIGRLGWLDRVFNTPSTHRVHHGSNAGCLDRNYGGILILWDRLFGTYKAETDDIVYGITKPLRSSNPLTINFHEYGAIIRDVWRAGTWANRLGYLFGRPGWRPNKEPAE